MLIERVTSLEQECLDVLLKESRSEGYHFVQRLVDEYASGTNRFDQAGESLFVARASDEIIGIVGLNTDPYLHLPDIGRVRHLYVLPQYRRGGIGKKLLQAIIEEAKNRYQKLTLYTDNPIADKMYREHGFSTEQGIHKASHVLDLVGRNFHDEVERAITRNKSE